MSKKKSFMLAAMFVGIGLLGNQMPLPADWTIRVTEPLPKENSCTSCNIKSGNNKVEVPFIENSGRVFLNIDLSTISPVNSLLFSIKLGAALPYSPANVYGISRKKDSGYLTVRIDGAQILFDVALDDLNEKRFFSKTQPQYSIRRVEDILVFSDKENDFLFSADKPDSWRLVEIRRRDCFKRNLRCEYNVDGQMTAIVFANGCKYSLEYKNGRICQITSPDGYFTEIFWGDNCISIIKTTLLAGHPFYSAENPSANLVRYIRAKYDKTLLTSIETTNGEQFLINYQEINGGEGKGKRTILNAPQRAPQFVQFTANDDDGSRKIQIGYIDIRDGKESFFIEKEINQKKNGSFFKTVSQRDVDGIEFFDAKELKKNNQSEANSKKYDSDGRLIESVNTNGLIQKNIYHGNLLMACLSGELRTVYTYDRDGRPVQTTMPDGTVHKFEWDDFFRLTAYTRPDGVRYEYRYAGLLNSIIEQVIFSADGKTSYTKKYSYDTHARLVKITYPDSTSESFAYNCCNLIKSVDRANAVTQYVYDAAHQKVLEISPNNEKTSFAYDNRGNLLKTTLPNGTVRTSDFDQYGRILKKTEPDGTWRKYSYNDRNKLVAMELSSGNRSQYEYDDRGFRISITGDAERNYRYVYDASGNLTEKHDYGLPATAVPRKTLYRYDLHGRLTQTINPDGSSELTQYSSAGRVNFIQARDIVTYYSYNAVGQITSTAQIPAEKFYKANSGEALKLLLDQYKVEENSYDNFGNLCESRGKTIKTHMRYIYSPDGELYASIYPVSEKKVGVNTYIHTYREDGIKETALYFRVGERNAAAETITSSSPSGNYGRLIGVMARKDERLLWQQDAMGNRIQYEYVNGQLQTLLRNGETLVQYHYDDHGRIKTASDTSGRVVISNYDANSRLIERVLPDGSRNKVSYDAFGRPEYSDSYKSYPLSFQHGAFGEIQAYTDGNRATTSFVYDSMERVKKRIWADGKTVENEYDQRGNLIRIKERGRISENTYDEFNRLTTAKVGDGTSLSLTEINYDDVGRISAIKDQESEIKFSYDDFGNLIEEKNSNGAISYQYNDLGQLAVKTASLFDSDRSYTTRYRYDDYGRVIGVDSDAGLYEYTYDRYGRIEAVKGPGYLLENSYNEAGRLAAKALNGKPYCTYQYDKLDRCIEAVLNGDQWLYRYDSHSQLISARKNGKETFSYEYDLIGNRLKAIDENATTVYRKNILNQYLSTIKNKQEQTVAYDDYGNMICNGSWKYFWDNHNRLIKAIGPDTVAEYKYDVLSRRIERKITINSKLTAYEKFLFDGQKMVAKINLVDNLVQSFTWHGDELLALSDGSGMRLSYIKDNYKNVIFLINGNGGVDSTYAYSPFGKLDRISGTYGRSNPYTFSSEQRDDAVDLIYYHYRYYAPAMGRWICRDPIEENGGINLYAFCFNTLSNDNNGLLPSDTEHRGRNNYSFGTKLGMIGGGGVTLNIIVDYGDHCCKSGDYKYTRKDVTEITVGGTAILAVMFGASVEVLGISLSLLYTGPSISADLFHTSAEFDECQQVSKWRVKSAAHFDFAILNSVEASIPGLKVTLSGSMGLEVGWEVNFTVSPIAGTYKIGLYATTDVSVKTRTVVDEVILQVPEKHLYRKMPAIETSGNF